jgi:hypothetical protein
MNTTEMLEKLKKDRKEKAAVLNSDTLCGTKDIVTGLYDENAHFIYELIQNSDDAGARNMTFILSDESVIMMHDGTRNFSVSDPDTEGEDKKNGTLGDLNSILSIGSSSKKFDGNKIGKFGCGFKSVFQYTDTPIILNGDLRIRIVDYIGLEDFSADDEMKYREQIKSSLASAAGYLASDAEWTTTIILPFKDLDRAKCIREIKDKFSTLEKPVLFLENLNSIQVCLDDSVKVYSKTVTFCSEHDDTVVQKVDYSSPAEDKHYWKVSRSSEEFKTYSLMFEASENYDHLVPVKSSNLFCYFATRTQCKANFLIHGAFEMNPSRTNLKEVERNICLKKKILELAVDAVGVLAQNHAYGDEILDFLPHIMKSSVSDRFITLARKQRILPCGDHYTDLNHAMFVEKEFREFFSVGEIRELSGMDNAEFIFSEVSQTKYISVFKNLSDFMTVVIDGKKLVEGITDSFMQRHYEADIGWLEAFYEKICDGSPFDVFLKAGIFLTENGRWVAGNGGTEKQNIFLNGTKTSRYESISSRIWEHSDRMRKLLRSWFREYSWKDELNEIIADFGKKKIDEQEFFHHLMRFIRNTSASDDMEHIKSSVKDLNFVKMRDGSFKAPSEVVLCIAPDTNDPSKSYSFWEDIYPGSWIIDIDYYKSMVDTFQIDSENLLTADLLNCFIRSLVGEHVYVTSVENLAFGGINGVNCVHLYRQINPRSIRYGIFPGYESFKDYTILGIYKLLNAFYAKDSDPEHKKECSLKIFKILTYFLRYEPTRLGDRFYSTTAWGSYPGQYDLKAQSFLTMLEIFYDHDGNLMNFVTERHSLSDFNDMYKIDELNSDQTNELSEFFDIMDDHRMIKVDEQTLGYLKEQGVTQDTLSYISNRFLDALSQNNDWMNMIKNCTGPDMNEKLEKALTRLLGNGKPFDMEMIEASGYDDSVSTESDCNTALYDMDESASVTAEGYESGFTDDPGLAAEDRKAWNENFIKTRGIPYLTSHGYDLENATRNMNIFKGVRNIETGKFFDICVKTSVPSKIKFSSHEIEAMKKKDSFLLLLFHNHKFQFFTFDQLWKKHETFWISCKTKDYNNTDMDKFINAMQFVKGTGLCFNVDDIADDSIDDEELCNLLHNNNDSYINTVRDDERDF